MILSGCVSDRDTSHYAKTSYSPEDMPKIVFTCRTDYSEIAERDEIQSEITFYDNKGNIYFTSDVYVCDMNYEERNKAFAEGKFEDKLVLKEHAMLRNCLKTTKSCVKSVKTKSMN